MKNILLRSFVASLALGFAMPAMAENPTHMDKAIAYLEAAKAELEKAQGGKGGWRVQALRSIDDAIRQVRTGKEVARAKN